MSRKKRKPASFTAPAIDLVAADEFLAAQHAIFLSDGYQLRPRARCYRCRNGTTTVQIHWTRPGKGRSDSYTTTIRGL
jgi:hypothetical protein